MIYNSWNRISKATRPKRRKGWVLIFRWLKLDAIHRQYWQGPLYLQKKKRKRKKKDCILKREKLNKLNRLWNVSMRSTHLSAVLNRSPVNFTAASSWKKNKQTKKGTFQMQYSTVLNVYIGLGIGIVSGTVG